MVMLENAVSAVELYSMLYEDERYRMGGERFEIATRIIGDMAHDPETWALLDVGCGRGEIVDFAREMGFQAQGLEIVPALQTRPDVHAMRSVVGLPVAANSREIVTCFDVLEHIPPGDTLKALEELNRVATRIVVLSIHTGSDVHDGVELHCNRRPIGEWLNLFQEAGLPRWPRVRTSHCGQCLWAIFNLTLVRPR
jgi:Methyltransferase domain